MRKILDSCGYRRYACMDVGCKLFGSFFCKNHTKTKKIEDLKKIYKNSLIPKIIKMHSKFDEPINATIKIVNSLKQKNWLEIVADAGFVKMEIIGSDIYYYNQKLYKLTNPYFDADNHYLYIDMLDVTNNNVI